MSGKRSYQTRFLAFSMKCAASDLMLAGTHFWPVVLHEVDSPTLASPKCSTFSSYPHQPEQAPSSQFLPQILEPQRQTACQIKSLLSQDTHLSTLVCPLFVCGLHPLRFRKRPALWTVIEMVVHLWDQCFPHCNVLLFLVKTSHCLFL